MTSAAQPPGHSETIPRPTLREGDVDTIFLSYGFREDERALAGMVEALLESHDIRLVTGEVLEGQPLTPGVQEKIGLADGLIAILTPRGPAQNGQLLPSTWVRDELNHARSIGKPAIGLVAPNVSWQGMHADAERVDFDPADMAPALLKLSREIGAWKRNVGRHVKVRILPAELESEIGGAPGLPTCEYQLTGEANGQPLRAWRQARIRLEPGGAFAYLDGVRRDALIELRLQFPNGRWGSRATPQWLHVELERS